MVKTNQLFDIFIDFCSDCLDTELKFHRDPRLFLVSYNFAHFFIYIESVELKSVMLLNALDKQEK